MKIEKTLFNYQKSAIQKLLKQDKVLLSLEMGLGKTFTSLKLLQEKESYYNVNSKVLILCQSKKLLDWQDECQQVFANKTIKIIDTTNLINDFNFFNTDILIMSYAIFTNISSKFGFRKWTELIKVNTCLILDESQILKSHKSKISKYILKIHNKFKWIMFLSGDPISTGYKDLFTQMKVLGCFDEKYTYMDFIKEYTKFSFLQNTYAIIINKYKNIDKLMSLLNDKSVFVKTKDAIDLPAIWIIDNKIKEKNEYFEKYKNNRCLFVQNEMIYTNGVLSDFTYLRELSSGFIKFQNKIIKLYDHKIDYLEALFNDIDKSNPIIIFYNFNQELNDIKARFCGKFDIYEINGDTTTNIKNIKKQANTLILIQYQSGSKGLDGLQDLTNRIIYYSPTLSGELYKQSLKRIHRIGQNEKCIYHRLIATNLEKSIYKTIEKYENYTNKMFESQFLK